MANDQLIKTGRQGVRTLVVSAASFATGFLLTVLGTEVLGLRTETAYSASILTCTAGNFFACRYYVFRSTSSPILLEAMKFFPSMLLFRAFEIFLFSVFQKVDVDYRIAYVCTSVVSVALKFLLAKFFIFRQPR